MPPKGHTLVFPWPVKGKDEYWSNRQQPILTTPDCLNVRSQDTIEGRNRGGKRPGQYKVYPDQYGSADAAVGRNYRMLGQVTVDKDADGYDGVDEDNFDRPNSSGLGAGWTDATWASTGLRILSNRVVPNGFGQYSASVRKPLGFQAATAYTVSVDIYPANVADPLNNGWNKCRVYLYARMDDDAPDKALDSVYAWLELRKVTLDTGLDGLAYSGALVVRVGAISISVTSFTSGTTSFTVPKLTFSLTIDGDFATVKLHPSTICTKILPAQGGQRVGFASYQLGPYANPIDDWRVTGVLVSGEPVPRKIKLVAACGGTMYYESEAGTLTALAGVPATVSDAHSFMCAEHGSKLYIADYGAGHSPKVYDATSDTIAVWTADPVKGIVPTQCPLICLYRNRIVLARDKDWYMSRVNVPTDFLYSETDAAAAVAGTVTTKAGKPGAKIFALIPWADDSLIFAGRRNMFMLSGDPNYGGQIDVIPTTSGVVDKQAWCYAPNGDLYYFAEDGLYRMPPHGTPDNVSKSMLPRELSNINTEVYEVTLAWNREQYGVMIFITSRGDGASLHYFFDVLNEGFVPDMYPNDHGPMAVLEYGADLSVYRKLLLGGRDGYIRAFGDAVPSDDGTAINSYVIFAPQRIAKSDTHEGIIQALWAALAYQTGYVDYEIRVADISEYAWQTVARETGRWREGGLKQPMRTRIRGGSMAIRLGSDTADSTWGVEKVFALAKTAGIVRMGQTKIPLNPPVPVKPVPPPSFTPEPPPSGSQDPPPSSGTPPESSEGPPVSSVIPTSSGTPPASSETPPESSEAPVSSGIVSSGVQPESSEGPPPDSSEGAVSSMDLSSAPASSGAESSAPVSSAAPLNACNDCDPKIPDTLYATFAGLAGDWAGHNNKYTLEWVSGCHWRWQPGGGGTFPLSYLEWQSWAKGWNILIWTAGSAPWCYKRWYDDDENAPPPYKRDCEPCDVTYAEHDCDDDACTDHSSCENSVGATVVVSEA